jgi:regulator of RNase E activity RraA
VQRVEFSNNPVLGRSGNDVTGDKLMSNGGSVAAPQFSPALGEKLRQLSTATLSMVLLKRGVRTSWLRGVAPLVTLGARAVGPAFTIRFVPGREDLSQPESYAKFPSFRDAIEAAPAGSVVVIDGRGNTIGATLGDILVARLAKRGVVAAVTDAPVRDSDEIRKIDLPVLCAGVAAPPSIVGLSFAGYDEMIGCGGVAVCPGDIMVCDNDGALVIPASMADEVADAGLEQELFESFVQQRIGEGASVLGLYPPDAQALEDYRKWLAARQPS